MSLKPFIIATTAAVLVMSAPGAFAKSDKAKGGKKDGSGSVEQVINTLVNPSLTTAEARRILGSFQLPPAEALPPGIAKNLGRGKPLPPGIAKKNLGANVLKELPFYDGYEWKQVGLDLVLVTVGTEIIAKVLQNVFH